MFVTTTTMSVTTQIGTIFGPETVTTTFAETITLPNVLEPNTVLLPTTIVFTATQTGTTTQMVEDSNGHPRASVSTRTMTFINDFESTMTVTLAPATPARSPTGIPQGHDSTTTTTRVVLPTTSNNPHTDTYTSASETSTLDGQTFTTIEQASTSARRTSTTVDQASTSRGQPPSSADQTSIPADQTSAANSQSSFFVSQTSPSATQNSTAVGRPPPFASLTSASTSNGPTDHASPRAITKSSIRAPVIGAVIGSLVLLLGLVVGALLISRRRHRPKLGDTVEAFPSHAEEAACEERKALRDARLRPRPIWVADKKIESLATPSPLGLAEVDIAAEAPTQDERASIRLPASGNPFADPENGLNTEGPSQVQAKAAMEAEKRFAALQDQIHQLRAEMVERDEREESEQPPSYGRD